MSALHPTIEQINKHPEASDKYNHISTRLIIDSLEARGFELDTTQVSRVRKQSNQGFQKHLVTMKYRALETKEGVPTILIQNSHNRTSGLKFYTGFIRFACLNGLILGNQIEEQSIRHSSSWRDKTVAFLDNYQNNVARLKEEHEYMQSMTVTPIDQHRIAKQAAEIRYKLSDILDPNELNLVRRPEDRGTSMYKLYNRLQESLIHGHFQRRVWNEEKEEYSPWGKAQKLTSSDEIIRVNKEVRELVLNSF